jgi:hypothetical protein
MAGSPYAVKLFFRKIGLFLFPFKINILCPAICQKPFEAAKMRHLRVRTLNSLPHPEVRALASLEGLVDTNLGIPSTYA